MAISVPQEVLERALRNAPLSEQRGPRFGSIGWWAQSVVGNATTVQNLSPLTSINFSTVYSMFVVGKNNLGQAGVDSTTDVSSFTPLNGNYKQAYTRGSFGWNLVLSATPTNDLWLVAGGGIGNIPVGRNFVIVFGVSNNTTRFTSLSTVQRFDSFIVNDPNINNGLFLYNNTLSGVGYNSNFSLGNGSTANLILSATPVSGYWDSILSLYAGAIALSAGTTDKWFVWGSNTRGQLGLGIGSLASALPSPVPLTGNWSNIFVHGLNPSVYALSAGTNDWYAWGSNFNGQLVQSGFSEQYISAVPFSTGGWDRVVPGNSNVFLLSGGTNKWFAVGNNFYGDFGNGFSGSNYTTNSELTQVPGEWKDLVTSKNSVFALSAQGNQWYAWGRNDFYQLGLGHNIDSITTANPVTALNSDINWTIYPGFTTFALSSSLSHYP